MKPSPVQRTIAELLKEGFERKHISSVERFFPKVRKKYDLFGFADLLCYRPYNEDIIFQPFALGGKTGCTRFVQVCGPAEFLSHFRKITETPWIVENAKSWLQCGNEIQLWEWSKVKRQPRSKDKRMIWKARIHTFKEKDFR